MKTMEIKLSQPIKELMNALNLKSDSKTIHHLIESGLMLKFTTVIHQPKKSYLKAS